MTVKMNLVVNPSVSQMSALFRLASTARESGLCPIWVNVSHETANRISDIGLSIWKRKSREDGLTAEF
jgi:hypothetical protein